MSDPLVKLQTINKLLEASLEETASVIELCVNHMTLALDGDADPSRVLARCSRLLDQQRQSTAREIERIQGWSNG